MGTCYFLVDEPKREVLSVGKAYWLSMIADPTPGAPAWRRSRSILRNARSVVPATSEGVAYIESIARWIDLHPAPRIVADEDGDDPLWCGPDLMTPLPDWQCWNAQTPVGDGWKAWPVSDG